MRKRDIIFAIILTVFLLIFLLPFASKLPDGLVKAARDKGFSEKEKAPLRAAIPGYLFPGIKNEKLSALLAGLSGSLAVFLLTYFLAGLLKKKSD